MLVSIVLKVMSVISLGYYCDTCFFQGATVGGKMVSDKILCLSL